MSEYSEYFLNSKSSVVRLELFSISHSNFTTSYHVVRNAVKGVTVTLENGVSQFFQYYPLKATGRGSKADLDQVITIELGDLGEILPNELDAVSQAGGFNIKPTVIYRVYRSDDLTKPLYGPLTLETSSLAFVKEGAKFEAKAPSLNICKTGELYTLERFPMLRGFL